MAALRADQTLILAGFAPLLPQLTYLLDRLLDQDHATWVAIDLPWVAVADALLRLPGESIGADREVATAHERGIR